MSHKQQGSARKLSPDTVTYRLDGEMVYVPPASDHQGAVAIAVQQFPDKLGTIDHGNISFCINSVLHHETRKVRISPMSWSTVISTLARYEIIDIVVQPKVTVEAPTEAPPQYASEEDEVSDTKNGTYLEQSTSKQRSTSPTPSQSSNHSDKTMRKGWIERLRS
ncbi:hypothetical protein GLOTRDRAFT_111103 [Gloeophyllum trabeum ATCC 11539]|uniref:Uncharacterized protein n=1 Tax=Gloeophyllum trabeum (strain ATCC 11539 / FP-39264 / Madison 617) TaxID=670483 RepID=S7Q4T8_GLOTA|nr:uncharacterized protein GLOTRDRAFT_111103 [Gloeophyllum trabeum ATCC 11539]EPQ55031.1 hypothetical protein GLOTRDRAFT_111103 [Gloeophyllum trabeum ATCC 11539]